MCNQEIIDLFGTNSLELTKAIDDFRKAFTEVKKTSIKSLPKEITDIIDPYSMGNLDIIRFATSVLPILAKCLVLLNRHKIDLYGKSSEKTRKKNSTIKRSEYEKEKKNLQDELKKLEDSLAKQSEHQAEIKRLNGLIRIAKKKLKDLDKKTIIDDTEKDKNDSGDTGKDGKSDKNNSSNDSNSEKENSDKEKKDESDKKDSSNDSNSEKENSDKEKKDELDKKDSSNDSNSEKENSDQNDNLPTLPCKKLLDQDSTIFDLLKDITNLFERIKFNREQAKNLGERVTKVFSYLEIIGNRIPVVNRYMLEIMTGGVPTYLNHTDFRNTMVYDCIRYPLYTHNLCNTTLVYRTKDGRDIRFPVSTALELCVENKLSAEDDGKTTNKDITKRSKISDFLCLEPDTDENIKDKEAHSYPFISSELLSALVVMGGYLAISPLECLYFFQSLYGCRPFLARGTISETFVAEMAASFVILLCSKTRLAKLYNLKYGGNPVDTDTCIDYLNFFGFFCKGTANIIRINTDKEICTYTDETYMMCLEDLKDENGNITRSTNYLSVHVSVNDKKQIQVAYHANKARSEEVILDNFELVYETKSYNKTRKYYMSDGLKLYRGIAKKLKEKYGIDIKHGVCFVHLRRSFIECLTVQDLLNIYKDSLDDNVEKFEDNLRAKLLDEKRNISTVVYYVLICTFLIDIIIRLDSDFFYVDREELGERRKKYSMDLLNKFFEYVKIIRDQTPDITEDKVIDGRIQYKSNKSYPWSKAIVYALNNEAELYEAIENLFGAIQNNISERLLRIIAMGRNNMLFLVSDYGFESLANILTVGVTDIVNDIPIYDHFYWLIATIKLRIEILRILTAHARDSFSQLFNRVKKEKGKNGEVIERYDDNNSHILNQINYNGTDGLSYAEKREEELKRVKPDLIPTLFGYVKSKVIDVKNNIKSKASKCKSWMTETYKKAKDLLSS